MANELWTAWQDGVAKRGGALSATSKREGNKLLLKDVHFEPVLGAGVFEMEQVALINQADGSVAVTLPETFPLVLALPDGTGETERREVVLAVSAPKLSFIVRGLGAQADFQMTAPELMVTLEKMLPAPKPEDSAVDLTAVLQGVDLRFMQDLSLAAPTLDGALSFEKLDAEVNFASPRRDDLRRGTVELSLAQFSTSLTGAYPMSARELWTAVQAAAGGRLLPAEAGVEAIAEAGAEATGVPPTGPQTGSEAAAPAGSVAVPSPSLIRALEDGLRSDIKIAHGPMSLTLNALDADGKPLQLDLQGKKGTAHIGVDLAQLLLELGLDEMTLAGQASGLALPDETPIVLPQLQLAAKLGVNGLRGPQDWSLSYVLKELSLPSVLWQQFDPQHGLTEAPISAVAELEGKYAVDPKALRLAAAPLPAGAVAAAPAEGLAPVTAVMAPFSYFTHLSLRLNALTASALGLEISGKGGVDVDPQLAGPIASYPLPMGRMGFVTTGAYALIDRLAGVGLLSQSELRDARAWLLMLGKTDGNAAGDADRLTTDLEFRDQAFFLNGHKIR